MAGKVAFRVTSLSVGRVPDKLARENIPVLFCREVQKNVLEVHIRAKDREKAFAILRSSCYHIDGVAYYGVARAKQLLPKAVGLFVGILLFFAAVGFFESRVLAVEVVGSGAYYEREIRAMLKENGVREFSAMPKDTGSLTARVLTLPGVEFCAFRRSGGVLTVEVQTAPDVQPIGAVPLTSPLTGTISALTVVRGTPLLAVGDPVEEGQTVVDAYILAGDRAVSSPVIASVTVERQVQAEYPFSEEGARAQALLDFGPLGDLHIEKTEQGCHVTGVMSKTASLGLA